MKTTKILTILVLASGLVVWQAEISKAEPMGTTFTYQGQLMDANDLADGDYDLKFKLFDDPSIGAQQGNTIDINDLDVINGYFTVELDFGSDVFDGDTRWLEVGVRQGDSNDPNAFVTLSPRQEITPVPYALQTRGIFVDNSGKVGIGTINPSQKLEVDGNIKAGGVKASLFSDRDYPSYYLAPSMNSHLYSLEATYSIECQDLDVQEFALLRNLTVDGMAGIQELYTSGLVYMGGLYDHEVIDVARDVMVQRNGELGTPSSSRKYKENIVPLKDNFTKILGAQPVAFTWKESKEPDIGLIAEDIDELGLKNLVFYDNQGRPESVRYKFVSLYLLEVVKELKAENEALKEQIKTQNQSVNKRLDALERIIQQSHLADVM